MIEYTSTFEKALPLTHQTIERGPNTFRRSCIRQSPSFQNEPTPGKPQRGPVLHVFWPVLLISLPVTTLTAVLLTVIFSHRIAPQPNLLDGTDNGNLYKNDILVNFSATRIVFLASFLSTIAPLLSSLVMSLYALLASQRLRTASTSGDPSALPTPRQMSLLVGLLLASVEQLKDFLGYALSRRRTSAIPPVVNRSAVALILTLLLAWSIVLTDSVLHYVTQTIDFSQIINEPAAAELGRGMSSTCLNFNRTAIFGWPCSVAIGWEDPNFYEEQNENILLAQNMSDTSEIRLAPMQDEPDEKIAYLLPARSQIEMNTEYRASTIGVSTKCQLISPSTCNFSSWGPESIYTNFTCSPSFWGTIGKTPNISEADGTRSPDPFRGPLMYKPAANLMYTFFSDDNMSIIYNSPGWGDDGQLSPDLLPLSDSQLVNPFHIAFAARTPLSQFQPTSTFLNSSLTYTSPGGNAFVDYILHCTVTSHDVTYTSSSASNSFQSSSSNTIPSSNGTSSTQRNTNLITNPTPNGTVLEIFHGSQLYTGIGQSGYDLQSFFVTSSVLSRDPASFTSLFAASYSTKVLAKIGAYTTPRTVLFQQTRRHLLVARIPKAALAVLVALALVYPLLAVALGFFAVSGLRKEDVRDVARQLSLKGVGTVAFGVDGDGGGVEDGLGGGHFVGGGRGGHVGGGGGRGGGGGGGGGEGDVVWVAGRETEMHVGAKEARFQENGHAREAARRVVRVSGVPGGAYMFKVLV